MTSSSNRGRVRKVAKGVVKGAGCTVVFASGLVAAVLLHLDVPATRRMVARQVSAALRGVFEGTIEIDRIGHLGLDGVRGVRGRVRDPEGVIVIEVDGADVRVHGLAALKSALRGGNDPILIAAPRVSIANGEVVLDTDANEELRIANAFLPKTAPEPPKPNEPPGRGVRIEAPSIRIAHAWVHGTMADVPPIDADVWDVDGVLHVDPEAVRTDVERARLAVRGLPRGVDAKGALTGGFATPARNGQGIDLRATFDGQIGGFASVVAAHLEDRRLEARVDVEGEASAAKAIVGEVELRDPLSIHAEAHGDLPVIETEAEVAIGRAKMHAAATIEAARKTIISGEVSARHVDLSAIASGAPPSDLGLDARGNVTLAEGDLQGEAEIDTLPGKLAGQKVPHVEVRASAESLSSAQAIARIDAPTMPTELAVYVSPSALDARVRSHVPDLRHVPMLPNVHGSAKVDASARLTLPSKGISANGSVAVDALDVPGVVKAKSVMARAQASGSIDRPVLDASAFASQVEAAALPFSAVAARARLEPGKGLTISESHIEAVRATRPARKVVVKAQKVSLGDRIDVQGVEIAGLGEPIHADFSYDARRGRDIRAKIDAPLIDLGVVALLAAKEDIVTGGSLEIRGEGALHDREAKGHIHLDAHDVISPEVDSQVHGANALVDASIDGRELDLSLQADVPDALKIVFNTRRAVVGGRPTDPRAWQQAYGRANLEADIDLAKVGRLARVPVSELSGRLVVLGRVGRDDRDAAPEVQLHVHTNGLVVAPRAAPAEEVAGGVIVEAPSEWRSTDVDFGLDVRNDGTSGFTSASFRATDRHGALVAIDGKAILPWAEIVDDPKVARDRLYNAPMSAKVVVPRRRIDQLPAIAATKDIGGTIEAELDASGTILDPRIRFVARGRRTGGPALPRDFVADSDLALDYDGHTAQLDAKVRSKDKDLLDLSSRVAVSSREILEGATPQWTAAGRVRVAEFPLETIPQIADRHVRGRVSGEVTLEGFHEDARLGGYIDLADLRVGQAEYPRGRVTLAAGGERASANVHLEQKDGLLDASAEAGISWRAALAPKLEPQRPVEARLVAKGFRAAAIQPFIAEAVPVLDGRLDADAHARLVPGGKPSLEGNVAFREGTVHVAVLGAELRRVRATAVLAPDGTIRVTDVAARGSHGELSADANVKLDGLRIENAVANLRIPEKHPLDLSVQGQPIGDVSGSVKVQATQSPDGNHTNLVVDVPKLAVELPKVTKTDVQSLEERENIRVGVYTGPKRFVTLPLDKEDFVLAEEEEEDEAGDGSRIDVDVRLGRVTVTRGNQATIQLAGNPKVVVENGETKLYGQIRAESGWVDVQGKKFEIEKGTVTFNGETPPNPVVVVTAGWTAADGSRVFADFVGPVKTGKVTLRSEPPRPKNEILALVLFGTADGANPTAPPPGKQPDGTTRAAVGLGGGFVAQGLTEALDDLSGIRATARIDTTRANNPRPELELQLSPKVSIGYAYVIGTPPITEPDRNLANFEYRFHRNWSVETTFGDRGTALVDAIWQKRY